MRHPSLLLAGALLLAAPFDATAQAEERVAVDTLFESMEDLELDTTRAVEVNDLVLERDTLRLQLKRGEIYFTRPTAGLDRILGAVFVGEGELSLTIPEPIERRQLEKLTDKEALEAEPFSAAFLRFNDDTARELESRLGPPGPRLRDAEKVFKERHKAMQKLFFSVDFPVIVDHLSEVPRNRYFLAEVETEEWDWLSYIYNPDGIAAGFGTSDEVMLYTQEKMGLGGGVRVPNIVAMFDDGADYAAGVERNPEIAEYLIHVRHYDMDLRILRGGLVVEADVTAKFEVLADDVDVIQFDLIWEVEKEDDVLLEKVLDAEGRELRFVHRNQQALVQLHEPLPKGAASELRFVYTADIIRPMPVAQLDPGERLPPQLDFLPTSPETYTLLNTYPWFPQYGYLRRTTVDWRVCVPHPMVAIASGETVRTWEERYEGDGNKYDCLHTVEETPIILASILFGRYEKYVDDSARPRIQVWSLKKQQNQLEPIAEEARLIIDFFEEMYGPFPYDELDIAQMSFGMGFGQAPPGLVQLTGEAFLTQSQVANLSLLADPGFRSAFLAHEIGHEWWGHVVGWQTYHDQWLSESFAEYSSALYILAKDGAKDWEIELRNWRRTVMDSRDASPIFLGFRAAFGSQRDYVANVYNKGPYVLRMLDAALQAQYGTERGHELFLEGLREFATRHRHTNPTTAQLQQVLREVTGIDLSWFFEQWFYGAGVPTLTYDWDTRRAEDGSWIVDVTIRQDEKDAKTLVVPIFVHYGKDRLSRVERVVSGPEFRFRLKTPEQPRDVTLDDNDTLLAEISREKG